MDSKDWKKAMEDTGFKYMEFVTSAKKGVARKGGEGWAYRVVEVDLEIRLPNGYFSVDKVKVDMELLTGSRYPDRVLCDEVLKHIHKALSMVGMDEEAG